MPGADAQHAATVRVPPALDAANLAGLSAALDAALQDERIPAVFLEGEPGIFCRGLDLDAASEARYDLEPALEVFAALLLTIRRAPKPIVAVVDGEAVGGGVGLAAAADVVLATERACFALTEALFGILPATILPVLTERMRPQAARLMVLTAERYDAPAALRVGLVDRVVEAERLDAARRRLRTQLSRTARVVSHLRRYAQDVEGLDLPRALRTGARWTSAALRDPAVVDGLRRYLERGSAPWLVP
jgi:enoyl-CoA hydratase/carnithine racemase